MAIVAVRPPLIDCLFPIRCSRLLLPVASLPFFSQVRHTRMRKSIKRYVTVLELTNTHYDVQLFRTIFATVDQYYPKRPFDAIIVPTTGRTARILQNGIIIITTRPPVCDHVYGTGNNQSNTHGLMYGYSSMQEWLIIMYGYSGMQEWLVMYSVYKGHSCM